MKVCRIGWFHFKTGVFGMLKFTIYALLHTSNESVACSTGFARQKQRNATNVNCAIWINVSQHRSGEVKIISGKC